MHDTLAGHKRPAAPALPAGVSGDPDRWPPSGTTLVEVHQLPTAAASTDGLASPGHGPAHRPRTTRALVEIGLFVVLAGAAFGLSDVAATRSTQPPKPDHPPTTLSTRIPARVGPPPRIVAPRSAAPGAPVQLLVLGAVPGARRPDRCGRVELRLDAGPVQHSVKQVFPDPADENGTATLVIVTMPTSAAPGPHEIALYAPIPGGPPGQLCADLREHQAPIATAPIVITSHRRPR